MSNAYSLIEAKARRVHVYRRMRDLKTHSPPNRGGDCFCEPEPIRVKDSIGRSWILFLHAPLRFKEIDSIGLHLPTA